MRSVILLLASVPALVFPFLLDAGQLPSGSPLERGAKPGHGADTPSESHGQVEQPGVTLHWLETRVPTSTQGNTWGVPWPKGKVARDSDFQLLSDSGVSVPVQSWVLGTWPDGSVKWSAHAIAADMGLSGTLALSPARTNPREAAHLANDLASPKTVAVSEEPAMTQVDTGVIQFRIPRSGTTLFESIRRNGVEIAREGKLVCLRRDQPEFGENASVRQEAFIGDISEVKIEQAGPIRAVVRISGKHLGADHRQWLPFIVRFYFYAGAESVRVMHTMVFDGTESSDFISGLGLRFSVPMRGALQDRHVRFVGESHGLWAEAVRGITGLRRDPGEAVTRAQVEGRSTPPIDQWNAKVAQNLELVPAFGDFSLVQSSADSFEIRKRTREGYPWLVGGNGRRSPGLGCVGSPQGSVVFGIRNFWQSYPSQLDIRGAAEDLAQVTLWLWSPEARPMDMRFYHDGLGQDTHEKQLQGLDLTYEDYEPGFSSATGVARTSELFIGALSATPSRERLVEVADNLETPPQLVCQPADLLKAGVFGAGLWSLPDRSTPTRARIEDQLDWNFECYKKEVEQRHWYGFWNYGDVMHTYDSNRHVWRYDVGGYAWDNSELSTDLWLWYSFLRSGRADQFRMAEAMTRHTGEVDVYHLGRFAGLGTRHGVTHWGDSAKQVRISTAANRRFLYYLTGDERLGELLAEQVDSDRRLSEINPRRKLRGKDTEPASLPPSVSIGTDWGAVSAGLLTQWERTGDIRCREKLVAGMKSIASLPHGWLSGGGDYDPATGKFRAESDKLDVAHLNAVFGAFEINAELLDLLDIPEYRKTWLDYCRLYNAGAEEQRKELGERLKDTSLTQAHSRLTAFAGRELNDASLRVRAWSEFFDRKSGPMGKPFRVKKLEGPEVLNPIDEYELNTNSVAQWGLAAIQCLGLASDSLPEQPTEQP